MHPAKRAPASSATPRRLSLDGFLPYRLAVLAREISVALARKYQADLGISIPEWRVIAHIAEVGTCSSGELCARTAMDKAKVNRAVTRLVAAGLVLAEILIAIAASTCSSLLRVAAGSTSASFQWRSITSARCSTRCQMRNAGS